jgi:hypothetical protein
MIERYRAVVAPSPCIAQISELIDCTRICDYRILVSVAFFKVDQIIDAETSGLAEMVDVMHYTAE